MAETLHLPVDDAGNQEGGESRPSLPGLAGDELRGEIEHQIASRPNTAVGTSSRSSEPARATHHVATTVPSHHSLMNRP